MSTTATEVPTCPQCGMPLAEDGLVDAASLLATTNEHDRRHSLLEDRAEVEQRLGRAEAELKAARKHRDEAAASLASRSIDKYTERLSSIDDALPEFSDVTPPSEGRCSACGTSFRDGRVDVGAATDLRRKHQELRAWEGALEEDLAGARNSIEMLRTTIARTGEKATSGPHDVAKKQEILDLEQRVAHTEDRIPEIEAAIARVRTDIARETPAARGVNRAFVGRPKGLRKRAETR